MAATQAAAATSATSKKQVRSLLLLLGGTLGNNGSGVLDNGGLVVLGDGEALAVGGEAEEGLAALAANVAIGVLGHVGGRGAVGALLLELLDLAGGLNGEVLEEGLGALAVLVGDPLGGGVDLLLALALATLGVNQGVHGALVKEAGLLEAELVLELGGAAHEAVNGALGVLLDLVSIVQWLGTLSWWQKGGCACVLETRPNPARPSTLLGLAAYRSDQLLPELERGLRRQAGAGSRGDRKFGAEHT